MTPRCLPQSSPTRNSSRTTLLIGAMMVWTILQNSSCYYNYSVHAWVPTFPVATHSRQASSVWKNPPCRAVTRLSAKKAKKKKGPAAAGLRGFGAAVSTSKQKQQQFAMDTDRSRPTLAFYQNFLEGHHNDASDNLKRTALATYNGGLRGLVATRDIPKGSEILNIPYELAINLGPEGEDPTVPAVEFLQDYCLALSSRSQEDDRSEETTRVRTLRSHYYRMLPPYDGVDWRGTTDGWCAAALEALQAPPVVRDTQERRARTQARWEQAIRFGGNDGATTKATIVPSLDREMDALSKEQEQPPASNNFPSWIDGTPVTADHLAWAVWIVTSRVLTVQGAAESGQSYRLLIPYLDMCNHDRTSPHVLTGRAVPGGRLKIVAGSTVTAGQPIHIGYGGGVAGNDRFLQDYGFLDADPAADALVAQALVGSNKNGRRRQMDGSSRMYGGVGGEWSEAEREEYLAALRVTTRSEDEAALAKETDPAVRLAIQYRLGVKQALSKFMVVP